MLLRLKDDAKGYKKFSLEIDGRPGSMFYSGSQIFYKEDGTGRWYTSKFIRLGWKEAEEINRMQGAPGDEGVEAPKIMRLMGGSSDAYEKLGLRLGNLMTIMLNRYDEPKRYLSERGGKARLFKALDMDHPDFLKESYRCSNRQSLMTSVWRDVDMLLEALEEPASVEPV